jgi:4a-hydroxytetrahydrobiopterin dehydratase
MASTLLTEKEIHEYMKGLKGWALKGKEIEKTVVLPDFVRAMALVNSVALLAERSDHHPDIDVRWNKVRLVLSTHSAGGLTANDFTLAKDIDAL